MERFQIGDYWLSKRPGSEAWHRTWFDRESRQTRRASLGTDDLRQAQVELARWVTLHQAPKRQTDLPLAQVLLRYYEHHGKHVASADSIKYNLRHWSEHFGGAMLSEITKSAQQGFIRAMKDRGLSDGYIQRVFTIGRAAMRLAEENGEIVEAPKIMYVPATSPEARVLTQDEAAALIGAVRSDHGLMFLALSFCTWARQEAILELTTFQVSLGDRLINLNPPGRTQNKKVRPTVPICDTLLPFLRDAPAGYLVSWYGRPISSAKTLLRDTAKRAGIGKIDSRTIRHTMATWARNEGVPWSEIEAMLGHSIRSTSSNYAKWIPRWDGDAARAIDRFLGDTQLLRKKAQVIDSA